MFCLFFLLLTSFGESLLLAQVHRSDLPILIFGIEEQNVPGDEKQLVTLKIVSNGNSNTSDGPYTHYDGFAGIELRGSTSLSFPKHGYSIELRDQDDEDIDFSLLGMPEEEDWVLHGPFSDKALLRNAFTYNLGQSSSTYAPRSRFCDVMFGGDYRGVYLLVERIKRDENRLDIANLKVEDTGGLELTGGYIIKVDKNTAEDPSVDFSFTLPIVSPYQENSSRFLYHDPKPDEIVAEQKTYIQDWMRDFESRLAGQDFEDEQLGYRSRIDMESWIDFFLFNELTRNVDGYRISTYLHKRRDDNGGKLHMGPIWDFNLALGNADYCDGSEISGWAYEIDMVCPGGGLQVPFHYRRMLEDSVFSTQLVDRWEAFRDNEWSDESLFGLYDSLALVLQGPAVANFDRWPILGEYVWPNNYVEVDHQDAVNYTRQWLVDRIRWLDGEIPRLAPQVSSIFSIAPSITSNGVLTIEGLTQNDYPIQLELYTSTGQILYRQKLATAKEQVDFSAKGLLFYKLKTVNGQLNTGKLFMH